MNEMTIEVKLSQQEYEQLLSVARTRQILAEELAQAAVVEWLRRRDQLAQARSLMRELGQGLGESTGLHDAAVNHDLYLYSRENL